MQGLLFIVGMMTTITASLPTPSRVNILNDHTRREVQEERRSNINDENDVHRYYFDDNDQLLADLWMKLCGLKKRNVGIVKMSGSSSSSGYRNVRHYPGLRKDYHDNDKIANDKVVITSAEWQILVESLQRLLRENGNNENPFDLSKLTSSRCEEEPMPELGQRYRVPSAEKLTENRKLLLETGEDRNDDILEDEASFLPHSTSSEDDDGIQRQVIFIEIYPETSINFHVHHQPQPQTSVYVLPPEEETHLYKISDMRHVSSSEKRASGSGSPPNHGPTVHFLTNFGGSYYNNPDDVDNDTENIVTMTGKRRNNNLNQANNVNFEKQFESVSLKNENYQGILSVVPVVQGVGQGIPSTSPTTFLSQQRQQQSHQKTTTNPIINRNLNNENLNNFEIWPAVNGYFFH